LGRSGYVDAPRPAADRARRHVRQRGGQLDDALAEPRAGRHDGHAELLAEAPGVHVETVAFGLVHQVQADHDPVRDLHDLQDQVEVALEPARVDDDDGDVRLSEEQEIARDLLVPAR
jgi:hypothetical protein